MMADFDFEGSPTPAICRDETPAMQPANRSPEPYAVTAKGTASDETGNQYGSPNISRTKREALSVPTPSGPYASGPGQPAGLTPYADTGSRRVAQLEDSQADAAGGMGGYQEAMGESSGPYGGGDGDPGALAPYADGPHGSN